MELSYEEKLKLSDSQEHLQVVLGNVRMATKEYKNLLSLIEKSRTKLENTIKEEDKIASENALNLSNKLRYEVELGSREGLVLERENKISHREQEFESEIVKYNSILGDIKKEISIYSEKREKDIQDYTLKITESRDKLNNLNDTILENEKQNKEKLRVCKEVENEILRLSSQKEKARKELEDFRKSSYIEMQKSLASINEEKGKIKNPLELIRRETEKLQIFKTDLAVLQARLIKQFELQNPRKLLPRELQNKSND